MRWRDIPPLQQSPAASEDPPEEKQPATTHFFNILLTTGYYTLTVPFKPVPDSSTGQHYLHRNSFQKYAFYTSSLLSLINRSSSFRKSISKLHSTTTPTTTYFKLSHSILHILPYLIYFYTITHHQHKVLKTFNSISSSNLLSNPLRSRNKILRILTITTQLTWLLLAIASAPIGYESLNSCCWTSENLITAYVAQGRFTFFLTPSINESLPIPEVYSYSGSNTIVGIAQFTLTSAHVFLLFFIVCLFGNCSIVLWANGSAFHDYVTGTITRGHRDVEKEDQDSAGVQEAYKQFVSVSESVNSTWHLLAFWYIIDLMSWLSTELAAGLQTTDIFVKIHIFYYLVYICGALCLSAEAFRKVDKLEASMKSNPERTESLTQVLKCLEGHVSGIGELGFFRINYSFIGQITGLIITFYIISVGEGGHATNSTTTMNPMQIMGVGGDDRCGPCYEI